MCDPVSITLAASTALTAAGSVVSGIQARQQGNYEAKVDAANQQIAVQARREAIDKGVQDQIRTDRKAAQVEGAQRASLAGSGVEADFGTGASLQADTALIGSENRQDIVLNTQRQAQGYSLDAMNYAAQGAAAKARGDDAFTNSLFSAGSTILGGASQVAKSRATLKYGGTNGYGMSGVGNIY